MIHARAVTGRFRTLRWWADAALVGLLVALPWIRIDGRSLILLDIPQRKFHVFGLVIFPQELFFLWLLVAGMALSLFFFTALLGRLWCGWACPQTVFTDLFAAIGRVIQGWGGPRPPRHVALWRRGLTHLVWAALCFLIAFHVVGYFVSPYEMLPDIRDGSLSSTVTAFLIVTAVLSYLDFVVVRQTFCKYLCPYARFQGVLMDSDSLVVGYDALRGDPRGKKGQVEGDCVDCGLCVQVCPSDIDIRDGLQLDCISCTQCIDACDGVMDRVGRDRGLIAYRSLVGLERRRPVRVVRPRVIIYAVLLLVVGGTFVGLVMRRNPMDLTVMHNRDSLVTRTADGRIGNSFTLRVENRATRERAFAIRVEAPRDDFELVAGMNPITIAETQSIIARVFVLAPAGWSAAGRREPIRFVLDPVDEADPPIVREAHFLTTGAMHGG